MTTTTFTKDEIGRRAKAVYEARIRAEVEPQFDGKIVAIDVDSGDYEIDDTILAATRRLKERRPAGTFFALRVGFEAAYALGGARLPRKK